jgi:glycosyltransferase involved in cell wall biosynthesis
MIMDAHPCSRVPIFDAWRTLRKGFKLKVDPVVSIVIPTKNSARFLAACLQSVEDQTYPEIEVLVVDGQSADETLSIATQYGATVMQYDPKLAAGIFDAPHRRNHGASQALGEFVYYVDADMELQPRVVSEAVALCISGAAAVIIAEDSFGVGIWARAKNLERRCYWGDNTIEAPRFFRKVIWEELGGLDESLGGGGDDWDLHEKLKEKGYLVSRSDAIVLHNEGALRLKDLMKKRFMYGRDSARYLVKRPVAGMRSYFPIRAAYLRHWRLFIGRPSDAFAFVVMRTAEYASGLMGMIYTSIRRPKVSR